MANNGNTNNNNGNTVNAKSIDAIIHQLEELNKNRITNSQISRLIEIAVKGGNVDKSNLELAIGKLSDKLSGFNGGVKGAVSNARRQAEDAYDEQVRK